VPLLQGLCEDEEDNVNLLKHKRFFSEIIKNFQRYIQEYKEFNGAAISNNTKERKEKLMCKAQK
jgi:hypothetical protein